MSWVASTKLTRAWSVFSRAPLTEKSLALAPLDSGPADWSRSFWSAAASSVACWVMFVSSSMLSSCLISSMESLIRSAPSEVAATTGRASRETRRVEMRQLRRAIRGPGPVGPAALGLAGGVASGAAPGRPAAAADPPLRPWAEEFPPGRPEESDPAAVGAGFWARWGEELPALGPVPPCGSGSAEALPSLLKRPCTSVATSGPGAPPRERRDGVGVVGGALKYAPHGGRE